ncbi:MAG: division/cell wall cluster transcriptional repressor MraZ [Ruminococcaceae bacterium]|nr:division/cell wall cluster transcriptional repressor MraZ [Oscillospiraceae bacterium]
MLMGEYLHTLDAKARVFVPAKLREELGDSFFLAKNVDGCLSLYPKEEWKRLTDKLAALPDSQTRAIKRFLFTFAAEVTPDLHGRITLPANLREFAGIIKDAAFLGVGDHAELWAAERWEAMKTGDDAAEIEKQMKELGL